MLLRTDYNETMKKFEIMGAAKPHPKHPDIVVAALGYTVSRPLAAQAADELLNIEGVSASFVLFADQEQVYISARSIGTANVQMILEPLGGGGNTATAGAQVKGATVQQVVSRLYSSIDKFYEK